VEEAQYVVRLLGSLCGGGTICGEVTLFVPLKWWQSKKN